MNHPESSQREKLQISENLILQIVHFPKGNEVLVVEILFYQTRLSSLHLENY